MAMELTENIGLALAALLLEALLGYPAWLYAAIGHPVSWVGRIIGFAERRLNAPDRAAQDRRGRGAAFMIGLLFAVGVFQHDKLTWNRLIKNGMSRDWSWARSAADYVRIYDNARSRVR